MKMTSAQAAKQLRAYNDELNVLLTNEDLSKSFLARTGENVEEVRPEYNYESTLARQKELLEKVRKLKHALNVFNSTTIVPEFGMTVDEMLVYIPQLSGLKNKLSYMKDVLPKQRERALANSSVIDYRYANYDVAKAKEDYMRVSDELARAQTALDYINNTVEFDF